MEVIIELPSAATGEPLGPRVSDFPFRFHREQERVPTDKILQI